MQNSAVQCSTVQCSAVQCSAVQYSTVQYSAVPCRAVQCSAVQSRAEQSRAEQCRAVHLLQYTTRFGSVEVFACFPGVMSCFCVRPTFLPLLDVHIRAGLFVPDDDDVTGNDEDDVTYSALISTSSVLPTINASRACHIPISDRSITFSVAIIIQTFRETATVASSSRYTDGATFAASGRSHWIFDNGGSRRLGGGGVA